MSRDLVFGEGGVDVDLEKNDSGLPMAIMISVLTKNDYFGSEIDDFAFVDLTDIPNATDSRLQTEAEKSLNWLVEDGIATDFQITICQIEGRLEFGIKVSLVDNNQLIIFSEDLKNGNISVDQG